MPQSGDISTQSALTREQRGFALLLVFAMAAAAAIFLYMQLPRVAFEAQRDREELLIQRGKDYQRAIELYVRRNSKYPERLEDLERQMEVRFLRRRHKDPLTGKDDWRVIRISASGQLEGSLVQKPKQSGDEDSSVETLLNEDENVAENSALARQRSGDERAANAEFPGGATGSNVAANGEGAAARGESAVENSLDDGLVPIIDASGNVVQQKMTESQAQQRQGNEGQNAGQTGNKAENTGQQGPRLGPGGIPIIENPSQVMAQQNAGAQDKTTPPATTGANMIGKLLTTPVPGGLAGIQQRRGISASGTGNQRQSFGAGIAGVASRFEMRGIKVYDEQESIHKWEFVFDARKQQQQQQQSQSRGRSATTPQRQSGYSGQSASSQQAIPPRSGRQ